MRKLKNNFWNFLFSGTNKITDKIVEKTKLKEKAQKIVNWAEQDRKRMLKTIIIFLVSCTIITITRTIILSTKQNAFKAPEIMLDTIAKQMPKGNIDRLEQQYIEYQEAKKLQLEIQTLLEKDTLTAQDSIRLIEIYNLLVKEEDE